MVHILTHVCRFAGGTCDNCDTEGLFEPINPFKGVACQCGILLE